MSGAGRDPFSDLLKDTKRSLEWGWSGESDSAIKIAIGILLLPVALVVLLGAFIVSLFRDEAAIAERKDREETQRLFDEVKRLYEAMPYAKDDAPEDFCVALGIEVCERVRSTPTLYFADALYTASREIVEGEGLIFGMPRFDPTVQLSVDEGVAVRNALRRKERFLLDHVRLVARCKETLVDSLAEVVSYLPPSVYSDEGDEEEPELPLLPLSSLVDLCEEPARAIERLILAFFDEDVSYTGLFDRLRSRFERNLASASGIPWERRESLSKALVFPTDQSGVSGLDLVDMYLHGTPFERFFLRPYPFSIPFPVRFEHSLVVGGTGHGKTQLLQLLICNDLRAARDDGRSIIIIDSQGDLIRTIAHLADFAPDEPDSLADRLLIIDPNDVEHPACLNMFDWNRERLEGFSPLDREKVLNGTIELYEYLFGALLGAELTQKQGVVFKYLARLMMEIPGATVHTLRELMENGEPFRPYMARLPATARSFFETRFFDRTFGETKKQILTRLWGVLSNATLERMFSHPRNKVDLFEAMNGGKIVLINTAKELLKQEGCAIFGRFFVALLAQATIQRAAIPAHERRPTFVYIDEAQDYFDQNIEHLLNQARKYRVGMVLAHQNLDQLSPGLRSSVMANTSIKFAGGVSAKDAGTLASEMRSEAAFIQSFRKRTGTTGFACFVKNLTPRAIGVEVLLGAAEALPSMGQDDYAKLIARNRAQYCTTAAEVERLRGPGAIQAAPAPWEGRSEREPAKTPAEVRRTAEPQATIPGSVLPPPQMGGAPNAELPDPAEKAPRRQQKSSQPAELGRGGERHRYLQQLVKQAAEERGFRAVIEEPILGGSGKVDVALTLGAHRIACEISVTTRDEQELGNIEKCLAAGFGEVVLLAHPERRVRRLQKFALPHLPEDDQGRVRFMLPEDFIARLDELSASTGTTETTVKGYRVRVTRKALSDAEALERRKAVAAIIARSLSKNKES